VLSPPPLKGSEVTIARRDGEEWTRAVKTNSDRILLGVCDTLQNVYSDL